jgi:hypothetical protein
MEYIAGRDLGHALENDGSWNEDDTKTTITQILEGLKVMHGTGIAHRDLKPEVVFTPLLSCYLTNPKKLIYMASRTYSLPSANQSTSRSQISGSQSGCRTEKPRFSEQKLAHPPTGPRNYYDVGKEIGRSVIRQKSTYGLWDASSSK